MSKIILLAANFDGLPDLFEHEIVKINSVVGAYQKILASPPDIVLLDNDLLGGQAFDILSFLRKASCHVPVLLISEQAPKTPSKDRLCFVHKSIVPANLSELIKAKLAMKSSQPYSLKEYITFSKKASLSIEIAICNGENEDCSTILFRNGIIIDSKFGKIRGTPAYNEILKIKNIDIRFRKSKDYEYRRKVDEEWSQIFFSDHIRPNNPTPIHGVVGIEEHVMKMTAQSLIRTTMGHGTSGIPFFNRELFYENEDFEKVLTKENKQLSELQEIELADDSTLESLPPFPAAKSEPVGHVEQVSESAKTDPFGFALMKDEKNLAVESIVKILNQAIETPKPPINIKGLRVDELLDLAMDEMIFRRYDTAHFILKATVKIAPEHATARANLDRLKQLLEDQG